MRLLHIIRLKILKVCFGIDVTNVFLGMNNEFILCWTLYGQIRWSGRYICHSCSVSLLNFRTPKIHEVCNNCLEKCCNESVLWFKDKFIRSSLVVTVKASWLINGKPLTTVWIRYRMCKCEMLLNESLFEPRSPCNRIRTNYEAIAQRTDNRMEV